MSQDGHIIKRVTNDRFVFSLEHKSKMSVLIANHNHTKILEMEQILKILQLNNIQRAENGIVAYEKALSNKFDIIILSLKMPIMNGLEAGKKIIEHYSRRGIMSEISNDLSGVPLMYAITDSLSLSDKSEAKKVGFNNYLLEPFCMEQARKLLLDYS
jgi:CheY-like chemotaxis protein